MLALLLLLAAAKVKLQAPNPQLWRRARIRRVCRTLEAVKSLLQRGGSASPDSRLLCLNDNDMDVGYGREGIRRAGGAPVAGGRYIRNSHRDSR